MARPAVLVLIGVVALGASHVFHASLLRLQKFSIAKARSTALVGWPIAITTVGMASGTVVKT
jgi:hypothetical protein